jgi:hypothetical protein
VNLLLQREILTDKSTIGQLFVDGERECFTLEDVVRPEKIFGKTAIPSGKFRVVVTESQRFKEPLPLLLEVPGYVGVRIHPGNTDKDTEGCILVGLTKDVDFIGKSQMAMSLLFPKIQAALNDGQECWIEIRNPDETSPMLEIS